MAKTPKPTSKPAPKKPKTTAAAAPKKTVKKPKPAVANAQKPVTKAVKKPAKSSVIATAPEVTIPPEEPQDDSATPAEAVDAPEPANAAETVATASLAKNQFTAPARSRRRTWGKRLMFAGFALLLIVGGLRWYVHAHPDTTQEAGQNKDLIAEVAARAVLPEGETPSITTVVDKSKVSQTFLQNARDGDKVLLYFQAGKAVVYRPSTHQIVNIGPLRQPPAQVFLRSGTASPDIPSSIKDKLNNPAEYTVVSHDASARHDYARTLVVDVTGTRPDVAARVARTIGAQVSPLPSGESRPDADILIIVGADAQNMP